MKKRLLFALAALLSMAMAQAQTAVTSYPHVQQFSQANGTGDWAIASNSSNSAITGFTLQSNAIRSTSYTSTLDAVTGAWSYTYYTADEWLVSPLYNLNRSALHFFLTVRSSGASWAPSTVQVYVSTTGSEVDDFLLSEPVKDTSIYYSYEYYVLDINLEDYYGQNVYIGVRYLEDEANNNASGLEVKQTEVRSLNTPVISLDRSYSLENIGTATTVAVSMTGGSTSGLVYSWTSDMMEAGTATYTLSDSEDTITVVHNAAGIDTLWAIVSNDYDTVMAYMVFEVVNFNPFEVDHGQPYSTGFEPGEDMEWTFFNNGANGWYFGGATAHSGILSLYVSEDAGESNTYATTGPSAVSTSYAVRALTINDAGEYYLNFNWKGHAEWNVDNSYVYLVRSLGEGLPTNMDEVPEDWMVVSPQLAYKDSWQYYETLVELDSSWIGTMYVCICWKNDGNNATSFASNEPTAIDNFTFGRVACISPNQFHASNIGTTTADLSWTPRGDEGLWAYSIDGGEWDTINSTSVSLVDLASGADHTAKLRAICDDESSTEVTITFRTECESISTFPWVEDFENYTPNYTMSIADHNHCYSAGRQATSTTPYPVVYTNFGSKVLQIISHRIGHYTYMILPPVTENIANLEMSLDLSCGSVGVSSSLIVGVLNSDEFYFDSTEFDTITTLMAYNPTSTDMRNYVVNFSDYTGEGHYIILLKEGIGDPSGVGLIYGQGVMYIDNIDIHAAPSCVKPADLVRVGATDASLTVSWSSDAPEYDVYLRATGGDGDWVWQRVTDTVATFADLAPGTYYDIKVRAICGEEDTSYAATGSFRTFCAIEDYPYAEHFSNSETAGCWLVLNGNGNVADDWSVSTYYGYAMGNYAAGSLISNEYLITPTFNIPTDVEEFFSLVFLYKNPYNANYPGSNSIDVMVCVDNNPLDVSNYTTINTITGIYNDWAKFTADMSQYAGHSVNIAFRRTCSGQSANRVYIDAVEMRDADAPVVAVEADKVANLGYPMTATATLEEGDATNLQYSWSSQMVNAGQATLSYSDDESSAYITYNTVGTDNVTVIVSNYYGADTVTFPVVVRDLHVITAMPYSTGFEDAADNALWITAGDTNKWYTGSAVSNGGANALYISNDGGAQNRYGNNASYDDTSYAHAYRGIVLDSGEYIIDLDWRCGGSAGYAFFRTYLYPANSVIEGGSDVAVKYNEDHFLDISAWQLGAGASGYYGSPSTWNNYVGTFTVTKPGLYILDFYWYSYMSVVNPAAAIDNLYIHKNTCADPIDYTLMGTTSTSATFKWFRGGTENQWEVTVGNNAPVVVDTNVYTADGLTPNTAYNVSIRAICGEGDTSYALTNVFYTQCEYITDLPWSEDFDDYSATTFETNVECWVHLGGARQAISDTKSMSGSAMRILRVNARDSVDFLTVLPKFHPTVSALEMSLYMAPDNGNAGTLELGYISNLNSIYNFVPLATFNANDSATFFTVSDSSFHFAQQNVSYLNAPDGSRMAIRNRVSSGHEGSWYIDSVAVKVIDGVDPYACAVPTDITSSKLMDGIYQVNWTAGDELKWNIEITHNGETEVRTIVNRPYTISQIQPDDHYYIRLKAICNLTAESDWSEVYDMNTATPIDTTPEPPDTTGIADVLAGTFSLMPNPASSTVTVNLSNVEGTVMVYLIDMNGRKNGEWTVEDDHLTIDLTNYARGAYFVRVVANEGTAVRKLIVQ